ITITGIGGSGTGFNDGVFIGGSQVIVPGGVPSIVGMTPGTNSADQTTQQVTLNKPALTVILPPNPTYTGQGTAVTVNAGPPTQLTRPSVEGLAVSLTYYAGTTATGTALPGAPVAVGTYTVVANFPGSLNYAPTKTSATYAITRAVPTFSFQLPDGAPYS